MTEPASSIPIPAKGDPLLRNVGEPLKLADLQLNGVSAEAARSGGGTIKIWTRLSLTSDDRMFHRIVENVSRHVEYRAREAGHSVILTKAEYILLVIRPDNTGELWIDTAAVIQRIAVKRPVAAGEPIFENDVADLTAMSFPLVPIDKQDRVVCIFREGWRFALFFDFNPDGAFSLPDMERDLGTLCRRLRYRELYDALANEAIFTRLVDAGWFPFVEILGHEFRDLANTCEAGFELDEVEAKLLARFGPERIERLFTRWMAKSHFAGKERLLRSALTAFASEDPVPVLKIALTEIEDILANAYRRVHSKGAKLKTLLEFAVKSAEQKSGYPDTLLFPASFGHYLQSHTFAKFDQATRTGRTSSRHAVAHGAADAESYTMVRALQALLTLDQLAFYT